MRRIPQFLPPTVNLTVTHDSGVLICDYSTPDGSWGWSQQLHTGCDHTTFHWRRGTSTKFTPRPWVYPIPSIEDTPEHPFARSVDYDFLKEIQEYEVRYDGGVSF